MKTLILFAIILLNLFQENYLFTQAPAIEWQKSYGGSEDDYAHSIQQTQDGGFIVAGYTRSEDGDIELNKGYSDCWVIKLDHDGNLEWQKTFGGSNTDYAISCIQTADNNFIVTCQTYSDDGDVSLYYGSGDCWIVKLDELGDIIWEKTLGGSNTESAYSIIDLGADGYIVGCGSSSIDGDVSGNHGNLDLWVVKLDIFGEIEWEKSYGGSQSEICLSITSTSDGGYVCTGFTESEDGDVTDNNGYRDYWLIKINNIGDLIWQKSFGGSDSDYPYSVSELSNKELILSGYTKSDDFDVMGYHGGVSDSWILKLDSLGNTFWKKCYGGSLEDESVSMVEMPDSTYIITGQTYSTNGDITSNHGLSDYWIIKIDSLGNIFWQICVGGSNNDVSTDIAETTDGGFIVCGESRSFDGDATFNNGLYDFWIVKFAPPCHQIYFYADSDEDGYGDMINDSLSCELPIGFVLNNLDCNDEDSLINPLTEDICNGMDDNCNGIIDEDAFLFTWYLDDDGDGYGDILNDSSSCLELGGYVFNNSDCDDLNAEINPSQPEICNAIDDNCNLKIDEDLIFNNYYFDADGDNYGNEGIDSLWCSALTNYVIDSTDCNDTNPNIYPGAVEILNGLDDDCDGLTDENLAINNTLLNAIKIYPNPAETILHIDYFGNTVCMIEILSFTGQVIYQNALTSTLIIDLSKFASGIYFLKIIGIDGEAGVKVVKE